MASLSERTQFTAALRPGRTADCPLAGLHYSLRLPATVTAPINALIFDGNLISLANLVSFAASGGGDNAARVVNFCHSFIRFVIDCVFRSYSFFAISSFYLPCFSGPRVLVLQPAVIGPTVIVVLLHQCRSVHLIDFPVVHALPTTITIIVINTVSLLLLLPPHLPQQ